MSTKEERNILVTGAARRVGRTIAIELARDGWQVAVHYSSSRGEAEEVVAEIVGFGGRAVAIAADLSLESEVQRLIPEAVAAVGPLTGLINNASIFEKDDLADVTRQSWDRHMEINLRAPFNLIQNFARQCPKDAAGNVVNLIDERVWNLSPYFVSYTVSKAALWTLTQTLAPALAPRIRINAIGPGPALPSIHQTAEGFERMCRTLPMQRGTNPDEIAQAIRFLLSAPSVTGQMIALDGGQHQGWLLPGQDMEIAAS
jgi:NAD(P)-dependent dehydrogenase (short-subunit alcohol dehydrogenase family)